MTMVDPSAPTVRSVSSALKGGTASVIRTLRVLYGPVAMRAVGLLGLVVVAVALFGHRSPVYAAAFCAVIGLLVGSWVSAVVSRPPFLDAEIEPLDTRWRCDHCRTPVRFSNALPVISLVIQRGRARCCGAVIGWWEPAAEIVTPLLFALVGWRLGFASSLPAHLVLATVAVAIALIDLRSHRIPTRIVYPATWLSVVLLAIAATVDSADGASGSFSRLGRAVLIGAVASSALWLLRLIYPAGMGDGDARLALLLGVQLGWYGIVRTYTGLFAGFILGAAFGLLMAIVTRPARVRKAKAAGTRVGQYFFAFGPYLVVGALLVVLWPSLVPTAQR